jgi:hypothetical protein
MVLQLLRECLAAAEPDSGQISAVVLKQLKRALPPRTLPPRTTEIAPGFTLTQYVHSRRTSILLSGEFSITRPGQSHVGRSRLLPATLTLRGEWNIYTDKLSVYPVGASIRTDMSTGPTDPKGNTSAYENIETKLNSTTTAKDVLKMIHTNAVTLHDKWLRLGFR